MEKKYVVFNIANEKFGIDITRIQEVSDFTALTTVSDSLEYVEGLINMRGEIVPIINLRNRLNFVSSLEEKNEKIIVTRIREEAYGFLVDGTSEIINIDTENVTAPSSLISGIDNEYIESIAKYDNQIIILIDFDKVIPILE